MKKQLPPRHRVARRADVDVIQWQALTRAFCGSDFARAGWRVRPGAGRRVPDWAWCSSCCSTGSWVLASGSRSSLASADAARSARSVMVTTSAFIVASIALRRDTPARSSRRTDHAILGFRPVTSRTYLAVRVTTILVHTTLSATLLGAMPIVVLHDRPRAVRRDRRAGRRYLTAIAVTLTIVAGVRHGCCASPAPIGSTASRPTRSSAVDPVVYRGFVAALAGSGQTGRRRPADCRQSVDAVLSGHLVRAATSRLAADMSTASRRGWRSCLSRCSVRWPGRRGKLSLDYSETLATLASATVAPTLPPSGRGSASCS